MVIKDINVQSPYTRQMLNAINALAGQGKKTFTPHELAEQMGSKITVSFRRRIAELQRDGVVEKFSFITERGGHANAYQICEKWEQIPLPEFPF